MSCEIIKQSAVMAHQIQTQLREQVHISKQKQQQGKCKFFSREWVWIFVHYNCTLLLKNRKLNAIW